MMVYVQVHVPAFSEAFQELKCIDGWIFSSLTKVPKFRKLGVFLKKSAENAQNVVFLKENWYFNGYIRYHIIEMVRIFEVRQAYPREEKKKGRTTSLPWGKRNVLCKHYAGTRLFLCSLVLLTLSYWSVTWASLHV